MIKKYSPIVEETLKGWKTFLDKFIGLPADKQKEVITAFKNHLFYGKDIGAKERKIYEAMVACLETVIIQLA